MKVPGKDVCGDFTFKGEKDELRGFEEDKIHGDEGLLLVFGAFGA